MSDPVTTTEIEDVLSSIRKLVANGREGHETQQDQERGSGDDRLVLTPSLRVDSASVDAQADTAEPTPAPASTEASAGDLLAAQICIDEDEDEVAPDENGCERSAPDAPDATFGEHHEEEPPAAAPPREDSLGHRAANFEMMVAGCEDQWEPDGGTADDTANGHVDTMIWRDEAEEQDTDDEDPDPMPSSDPDHAEPDDAAAATYAHEWRSGRRSGAGEQERPSHDWDSSDPLSFEDAILDEEALRDLVTDIVRQELQGALGERITRNVRKLVRREIHRALTSQDFD